MAAREKRCFADELRALSAALTQAGTLATSLKELHDADIRRASAELSDLTARNRELKLELAQGSSFPGQVIDTEKTSENFTFHANGKVEPPSYNPFQSPVKSVGPPPETCKVMPRLSTIDLRDAGASDSDEVSVIADAGDKELAFASTRSLGSEDSEVLRLDSDLNAGGLMMASPTTGTWTSGMMAMPGMRPEWEDANDEVIKSLSTRCSVRIVGMTTLQSHGAVRQSLRQSMNYNSKFDSCHSCLASTYDRLFGILNPVGPFRCFWNAMCLLFIGYDLFAVPMQAFDIEDVSELQVFEWILTIWWTADVFMTFRTGYIVGSRVEMRPKKIALHYAKTWLFVDIIIVVLEWVNRFAVAIGSASLLRSSRALRTVRFLKLFRVTKMHNFWKALQDQINSNVFHLVITMTILGAILLLTMHITTCIWYAIGTSQSDGWVNSDVYEGEKTMLFRYVASFRWVVSQFNGRTDLDERRNMQERFFTCTVGIALAVIAQAVFISVITKTMLDLSDLVSSKTRRRRIVNEYLETNPLPPTLTSQVKRCLHDYQDINQELQKEDQVLAILPKHLQSDVLYEVRSPVLVQHHFFHNLRYESPWNMKFVCWKVVKTVSATKDEVVFEQGDMCDRMLFTDKLTANYFVGPSNPSRASGLAFDSEGFIKGSPMSPTAFHGPPNKSKSIITKKLKRSATTVSEAASALGVPVMISTGDWISEVALWIEWRNKGRLVSNGHGLLVGIQATKLANALKKHPDAFALASLYAKSMVSELRQRDPSEISDVLPFEVQMHSPVCVRITIISAEGLRNADGFFTGKSDPYCVCKVIGLTGNAKSSDTKFKTHTIDNDLNPVWNHSSELMLSRHQFLEFQVWDFDFPKRDTNLGIVRLAADDFFPDGFEGDLELCDQSGGRAQGSLNVKVEVLSADQLARLSVWNSGPKKHGRSSKRRSFFFKN